MTEDARIVVFPFCRTKHPRCHPGRIQGREPYRDRVTVNEWMKRHPEYVGLVPAAYRANFNL